MKRRIDWFEIATLAVSVGAAGAECAIESLSISPDGVSFRRVVIVEGTYDG